MYFHLFLVCKHSELYIWIVRSHRNVLLWNTYLNVTWTWTCITNQTQSGPTNQTQSGPTDPQKPLLLAAAPFRMNRKAMFKPKESSWLLNLHLLFHILVSTKYIKEIFFLLLPLYLWSTALWASNRQTPSPAGKTSFSPSSLTDSPLYFSSPPLLSLPPQSSPFSCLALSWPNAIGCVLLQPGYMLPLTQLLTPFSAKCLWPGILPFVIYFPHLSQCQEHSHHLLNDYLTENRIIGNNSLIDTAFFFFFGTFNKHGWSWRGGLMINCSYCSGRGTEFSSQHLHLAWGDFLELSSRESNALFWPWKALHSWAEPSLMTHIIEKNSWSLIDKLGKICWLTS